MSCNVLSLAYYLPQFHEIEENNLWWGQGFTEWANLRDASIHFPWQKIRKPIEPLGEYNLLQPEILELQNRIAKNYGIDGFMVFDYWFGGGQTLLEKPMQMALEKQLDFDYCFCWANHTWFNKRDNIVLREQQYLGVEDYTAYFYRLLPHFQSAHYIKIDNKPIFAIFNPKEIPDIEVFIETFQSLAAKEGLAGLYLIAENTDASSDIAQYFDRYAKAASIFKGRNRNNPISYLKEKLTRKLNFKKLGPFWYDFPRMVRENLPRHTDQKWIPTIFSGWDTTPRHNKRGTVLRNFNVESFREYLASIKPILVNNTETQKIIIIKSWNEWAEGNVLEPDNVFGYQLLEVYKEFVSGLQSAQGVSK